MLPKSVFTWKGQPYFSLGIQAHNSSGYTLQELENVWQACEAMTPVDTCAIAVSWERIEPEEGRFELDIVAQIIEACRSRGLKLILLWFGTWKNGHMKYVPRWVKTNHQRFPRVITHDGYEIANLSSFSQATRDADARAFCKVLEVVRREDPKLETVLAVQVENELGIVGRAVRDYGPQAQQQFYQPVPSSFIEKMKAHPKEEVSQVWQACGAREEGDWPTLFGHEADQFFQAWSMAHYVEAIAAEGKKILNVPMYTNVWLDKQGYDIPGISYPSGGPVMRNLPIWRWEAPSLDMICPDLYMGSQMFYREVAQTYAREDNPLYVPETGYGVPAALGSFWAIAHCGLTGVHCFGAENMITADGQLKPEVRPMFENFQCLSAVKPLLTTLRGTGCIQAVIQEEFSVEQRIHCDGWDILATFAPYPRNGDYRHRQDEASIGRGRALIFQTGPNEFYACGVQTTLNFRKRLPPAQMGIPQQDYQQEYYLDYLAVEEGRFDENGQWQVTRIRNGDQTDFAVFLFADNGAVRVVLE